MVEEHMIEEAAYLTVTRKEKKKEENSPGTRCTLQRHVPRD
jgi:hypothetical protein